MSKLSLLLLVLLLALLLALPHRLVAALAGAAGATLARALRIRGLLGITGLRATWFTAFAQAAIGAMLGLLTYWAFDSELVNIANWKLTHSRIALLAAAGGFIEPFSLGILERISQTASAESEDGSSDT